VEWFGEAGELDRLAAVSLSSSSRDGVSRPGVAVKGETGGRMPAQRSEQERARISARSAALDGRTGLAMVARKDGELRETARAIAGAETNRRAASAHVRPGRPHLARGLR
jgi:hypothetical protein